MSNTMKTIDDLTEQLLVDYTAWVNGEPVAWNVNKREFKQAIEAYKDNACREMRTQITNELQQYRDDLLASRGIRNPTWIGSKEVQIFIDNLKSEEK